MGACPLCAAEIAALNHAIAVQAAALIDARRIIADYRDELRRIVLPSDSDHQMRAHDPALSGVHEESP